MSISWEPVEEALEVLVQQGMPADPVVEGAQLISGRQHAVDQQVRDLGERGLLGELLDAVPAVPQDACVTIDVGDL